MARSMLEDPAGRAGLVEASAALDGFWSAAPAWLGETARREVGGQVLAWNADGGLIGLSTLAAAVAVHFDGRVPLAELADDLADVAGVTGEVARAAVASVAVDLQTAGMIAGVPVADGPPVGGVDPGSPGELVRHDPATGEPMRVVIEVVDGNRVITEHLPDGRRRVTTELTFTSGGAHAAEAAEAMAAAVLSGERSAAELVPPDSCLGAKLRDGEHVPLVSVRCPDGIVRSIRCHDREVAAALSRRAGDRLVTSGARGPVEAFVVSPLEGDGPVRIYDGRGARRGRPRTPDEAVDVVDQILGEASVRSGGDPSGGLPLALALVFGGDDAMLVDPDALEAPGVARSLVAAGWTPTWGTAVARAHGVISSPSALGEPRAPRRVACDVEGDTSVAALVPVLAGSIGGLQPSVALDRLADVAERLVGSVGSLGDRWPGLVRAQPPRSADGRVG